MKDMKTVMVGAFLVTLVAAVPARAQGVRPVLVNIGGGWTIPIAVRSPRDLAYFSADWRVMK